MDISRLIGAEIFWQTNGSEDDLNPGNGAAGEYSLEVGNAVACRFAGRRQFCPSA